MSSRVPCVVGSATLLCKCSLWALSIEPKIADQYSYLSTASVIYSRMCWLSRATVSAAISMYSSSRAPVSLFQKGLLDLIAVLMVLYVDVTTVLIGIDMIGIISVWPNVGQ